LNENGCRQGQTLREGKLGKKNSRGEKVEGKSEQEV